MICDQFCVCERCSMAKGLEHRQADMANIKRRVAKDIFLGLCYGMDGAKLCDQLGLPTRTVVRSPRGVVYDVDSPEGRQLLADGARRFRAAGIEGQALLDKFDAAVPFIRKQCPNGR